MQLSLFNYLHFGGGIALQIILVFLVLRRGLARRFPVFLSYLILLVLYELIYLSSIFIIGYKSHAVFMIFWTSQEILLVARGAVVAELCWQMLRPYKGIWEFCRLFLMGIGTALLLTAIWEAKSSGPWLPRVVNMTDRGLEFTTLSILLFGLAFCRYYRVELERPIPLIALGLGIYSAVQVVNDTLFETWLRGYYPLWGHIRVYSFDIALALWLVAVWKALPARRPAPVLLTREVYDELSPQMTLRLRELNSRLLEILK